MRSSREEVQEMGQIGYFNHNSYPVDWQSAKADRGRMRIEPGAPVLDRYGALVVHDDDLEIQVEARFLSRIVPNTPKYKEFLELNKRAAKQRKTPLTPAGLAAKASQGKAVSNPAPTGPTVPAPIGPDGLPVGAVKNTDGSITYSGRNFASVAALHTFLDSVE